MTVRVDPENNESRVLFEAADFTGKDVLEIGSGDGRLTWLYADRAAHVTAIEPFEGSHKEALENLPLELEGKVEFHNVAFEDFLPPTESATYDIVLLAWSLC